jgi:hypothetical protein
MDPLTMMAISGVLGAGAGIYGANQAGKSSEAAMRQAQAQQDAAYQILLQNNPELLKQLVNTSPEALLFDPEEYGYIEGGSPILYGLPVEAQSTLVGDSPEMRAMQMDSLSNLQERSEEGLSAQDQADFLRGRRRAGEMARGREGAIINNMQARGMSGSGVEAAMRMIASQEGANRLSESQADQASTNAMVREQALRDLLSGSSAVRGQDIALNATNADILNSFAMENSRRQNEIKNARVDQQNRFNENETSEQRRISGMNTGLRNDAQLQNNATLMTTDQQKKASQNQNLMDYYNALYNKNNSLAGAKLGALPGIYAQGAQDANIQAGMYNTTGSTIQNLGNAYAMDRYMNPQPKQQPTGIQGNANPNRYGNYA